MAQTPQNPKSHVVEIPVIYEEENKNSLAISTTIEHHHPLSEISQSPGHFLLLKLLQRQEDLLTRLTSHKESRKDSIQLQIFNLCCFFFIFQGLFFSILFTTTPGKNNQCSRWWIPLLLSACTSLLFVFLVHLKLCRYWKVYEALQRDRNDARAVTRIVQELRMKGKSFDLCKEPLQSGKRLKSSSVEITWRPLTWCVRYRVSALLVCFAGLALACCRFVLCV